LLSPNRARTLIPAVKGGDRQQAAGIALALHDRAGRARLYGRSGLRLSLPCSVPRAPPPTEPRTRPRSGVVSNLRELGHSVRIDAEALAEVGNYFTRLAAAEGLPAGVPQAFDAGYLRHQLPGGVVGTMRRHLEESRLSHLEQAVVEELGRVRESWDGPS